MALTRHEALKALVKTRDKWPRDMFEAAQYAPDGCPSFDDEWYWHYRESMKSMILASDDLDFITREEWLAAKGVNKADMDPNNITKGELPPVKQWPEYAKIAVMQEDGGWIFGTFEDARATDEPKGWEGIGAGWWYPGPRVLSEPLDRDKWKEAIVYRHSNKPNKESTHGYSKETIEKAAVASAEGMTQWVNDQQGREVINDTPLGGMDIDEMFEDDKACDTPRDPGQHYRKTLIVDLTTEDIQRGYVEIKIDPYRICDLYGVGGGPREQLVKKGLRGTSKGQTEQEVIDDMLAILDRWEEMADENTRMKF